LWDLNGLPYFLPPDRIAKEIWERGRVTGRLGRLEYEIADREVKNAKAER
jgi:hypothetical protein